MHEVPSRRPPTVRLRRLAQEMQRLREAAGLSAAQAAERVHMDPSSLWRLEHAKGRPLRRTVLVLLDLYGVNGPEEQARYVELLAKSQELNWLTPYEDEVSEDYQTFISFEADAARLTGFEQSFVPGLLQTPDYAQAVIRGAEPFLQEDTVRSRAEVRARRQEAIARKETQLWFVLDEAILHRVIGGTDVQAAQLRHLAEQARRKHITVQVVPFESGAHPGTRGSFMLMDFPEPDPALVYIETQTSNVFLERAEEVALYRRHFEHLIALAASPGDSLKMMTAKGS